MQQEAHHSLQLQVVHTEYQSPAAAREHQARSRALATLSEICRAWRRTRHGGEDDHELHCKSNAEPCADQEGVAGHGTDWNSRDEILEDTFVFNLRVFIKE